MNTGKRIRMSSIFRKDTENTVIIAADHGGIAGPMPGLTEPRTLIAECVRGGADAVLTTRGFAGAAENAWERSTSLIIRVTGGFTTLGGMFEEQMISSAEAALRYGACAVAATVKFGHSREGEFIRQVSLLADDCERWGLPLMVEALAGGNDGGEIGIACRAAAEIGADFVKTPYTGDPDSFAGVVEGCPVPVLILGGAVTDKYEKVFSDVYNALQVGAKGIAMGRNIWQDTDTTKMVTAMAGLVHRRWTAEQACDFVLSETEEEE